MNSSHTIYVGNIQSLKDDQLRDYFQRFGQIEALYHNCTRAAEEWLIDHRFIRFTSDTDMSVFLTNQVDHMICRIRLDIHPYQVAFRDETRLISDRKICIAHTDSKLNRNVIKKAFTKYGRILNCTCVSSGNGVEYVYIEFESINVVRSITEPKQRHFAGRTPLAVEKILRPSQIGAKLECISVNERESTQPTMNRYSRRQKIHSNIDTAQYSSVLVNRHNSIIEEELQASTRIPEQLSNCSLQSQRESVSISSNTEESNSNNTSFVSCSPQQLKDYERDYDIIIRQDFDEVTYQVDKLLRDQNQSYKKLRRYILNELHSQSSSSSSSNEDGEIDSTSSSFDTENTTNDQKKRLKSHH